MPKPLRLSPGIGVPRLVEQPSGHVSKATTHSVRASWSLLSSAVHQSSAASSMGAASWTVFLRLIEADARRGFISDLDRVDESSDRNRRTRASSPATGRGRRCRRRRRARRVPAAAPFDRRSGSPRRGRAAAPKELGDARAVRRGRAGHPQTVPTASRREMCAKSSQEGERARRTGGGPR